jgi:hypothetical protein
VGKEGKVGMFLVRMTTDVTLTFFQAWLKTFPTFPTYPSSVTAAGQGSHAPSRSRNILSLQ